jgi:hypothetical protein
MLRIFNWRRFLGLVTIRMMIRRIETTQRVREFVLVEEDVDIAQRGAAISRIVLF